MIKIRKLAVIAFLFIVLHASVLAQDKQARVIIHPTLDLSQNWYLTSWVIGNARAQTPRNGNFFLGIGFRNKDCSCWLDSMVQRQYSESGRSWLLDFRFLKRYRNGTVLYVEPAPFLDKKAFYNFVYFETPLWRKFKVGAETENIHRSGSDSIGVGPRVSYTLGSWKGFRVDVAASFQFRRAEPNVTRLYLVFGRRF